MDVLTQGLTRPAMPRLHALAPIALLLAALCVAQPAQAAKKWAFLIGLNEYQNVTDGSIKELRYAVADVRALEQRLLALGYDDVKIRINDGANRREILAELQRYAFKVRSDDTFLLFYAGHGVRRSWGQPATYWLTYTATLQAIDQEGIRLSHLIEYVQDIRAERKMVLLDHCFSGDLGGVVQPGSSSVELAAGSSTAAAPASDGVARATDVPALGLHRGLKMDVTEFRSQATPSKGLVVLAAANNEALELDSLEHGIFTEALMRATTARAGGAANQNLTWAQLVSAVQSEVRTLSSNRQDVTEILPVGGTNIGSWVVFENLPMSTQAQADLARERAAVGERVAEFNEKLIQWENEGHLEFETRIRCEEALINYRKAVQQGLPLTVIDDRIYKAVRQHVEIRNVSISTLGNSLKRAVADIIRGQGAGPGADPQ